MGNRSFAAVLTIFVSFAVLAWTQTSAALPVPQTAAGAPQQGWLATPTPRLPKDASSLYLPLVMRDATGTPRQPQRAH
jgi:hypothetical protein